MELKQCNRCYRELPYTTDFFYKKGFSKAGRQRLTPFCKNCGIKKYQPPKGFTQIPISDNHWIDKNGNVWSKRLGQCLKPYKNVDGYLQLIINNTTKCVHRLLLETFVGPCLNGMECRHIDGNSTNNSLDNLCWGNRIEQCQDKAQSNTLYSKVTKQMLYEIQSLLTAGHTQKTIANKFNIDQSVISKINTNEYERKYFAVNK